MVASRWPWRLDFLAAAIKRSISAVVRYSRVRTEEFTVVGADRPPVRFPTIFCPRFEPTGELSSFSSLASIGVVGIHGQPWSEVSRPYGLSESALNRLRTEAVATLPWASILHKSFKSLKEHRREQSQRDTRARTSGHVYREWAAPLTLLPNTPARSNGDCRIPTTS